jgi:hypothetical protein
VLGSTPPPPVALFAPSSAYELVALLRVLYVCRAILPRPPPLLCLEVAWFPTATMWCGIYALIWPCRVLLIPRRLYLAASARVSLVLFCVCLYAYFAVWINKYQENSFLINWSWVQILLETILIHRCSMCYQKDGGSIRGRIPLSTSELTSTNITLASQIWSLGSIIHLQIPGLANSTYRFPYYTWALSLGLLRRMQLSNAD